MLKKTERFGDIVGEVMHKNAAFQSVTTDVPKDVQLDKVREHQGTAATTEWTMEGRLREARSGTAKALYEVLLEDHRKETEASNAKLAGITEARLNQADKKPYPHRNPEAWERTGQKRPINSLREELGDASDDAKRERYEKAISAQETTKRIVDKDQRSQLPKAYNAKTKKAAALKPFSGYLAYRAANEGGKKGSKFAEVATLDAAITRVLSAAAAADRFLNEDEIVVVNAMKNRKTILLRGA